MKKRIISIMLVLCMLTALIPHAAAADSNWDNKIWIGDTPVNKSTNMTDSTWVFFPLYNILVLNDGFEKSASSKLTGSNDKAVIRIESFEDLTIQVVGNATVGTAGSENSDPNGTNIYGIYAADTNLVIEGDGTLNVYSNSNALWCKCLKVEGSTLNCNSYRTAIRVMGSTGYVDLSIGSMNVNGGAKVTARTVNGGGVYPEKYYSSSFGTYGEYYKDEGGAAILVSTFLIVENQIVVLGHVKVRKYPIIDHSNTVIIQSCNITCKLAGAGVIPNHHCQMRINHPGCKDEGIGLPNTCP